ncbi:MAG: 50S ribosomal protein L23 [Patescibacteria group bacterium]
MSIFSKKDKKVEKVLKPQIKVVAKEKIVPAKHLSSIVSVLKKPWVSEKATNLGKHNQYVFLVDKRSNKNEVKEEIRRRYGVEVTSVNTVRKQGKVKRYRNFLSRQELTKKAIVTLKAGQKLEIV